MILILLEKCAPATRCGGPTAPSVKECFFTPTAISGKVLGKLYKDKMKYRSLKGGLPVSQINI